MIDGAIVITGSFNFTEVAQEHSSENLLVIRLTIRASGIPVSLLAAIAPPFEIDRNTTIEATRCATTGAPSSSSGYRRHFRRHRSREPSAYD